MGALAENSLLAPLLARFPRAGEVRWIGVRPARHAPVEPRDAVRAIAGRGLEGDRNLRAGNREVTLIQAEHLAVVGALLGRAPVDPGLVRRNVVVAGINLLASKGRRLRVGEALLEITGQCHPCSRMELLLGDGGYNAMRGHGGMNARVVEGGLLRVGDAVRVVAADD